MKVVVARARDFKPGERRIVEVGRRSIGVFRVGDRFYAINNHCPHQGGPLCLGRTLPWATSTGPGDVHLAEEDALLACPWHGWEYDLATGQSFLGPGEAPVRSDEVSVETAGALGADPEVRFHGRIPGPYVAETFPVHVEEEYVVVDTRSSARDGRAPQTGRTGKWPMAAQTATREASTAPVGPVEPTLRTTGPAEPARRRIKLIDADIHPAAFPGDIVARLDEPWRTRFERFGHRVANPPMIYPRVRNGGMRVDSWPEEGVPGSDLALVREQLLDEYGVDYGILIPLRSHTYGAADPEFSYALCHALNEWLREEWLDPEPRLRASICVPHESPELAAREIERCTGDPRFVQVLLPSGTETSLGRAKYWPLYDAAARAGLPVAVHLGGIERHRGDGWPSFYLEQHIWYGNAMAAVAVSLVCEGVFERFPALQVVLVEGGIAWAGPLMWAMDSAWSLLREDVPHLRRPPSEYFREHFWFTTQPIEEPDNPEHLVAALEHTGMTDRILFASDYPHWDFDSPKTALRDLPKELRDGIMAGNPARLYGRRLAGLADDGKDR